MIRRRGFLRSATAGLIAGFAGCTAFSGEQEVINQFTYDLNIEPARLLPDATLYVPIPVLTGEPALTGLIDEAVTHLPSSWSGGIVETERGPKLELRAGEIDPNEGPYYPSTSAAIDREIDTREALVNEPTLGSHPDLTQVDCDFPYPDRWEGRLRCYRYESDLFGEYAEDVPALLSVGLSGENRWWNGGWSGNEYFDRVSGSVDGDGWVTASASFREGSGNYR